MKRRRSDSFRRSENKLRLQTVPWFSKSEWISVFEQIYSKEKSLQEKAYTQMCIWKTRYPNLPLGVECTLSMLHVKLCDNSPDDGGSIYKEKDLQLLYSTAVMRFLNHLSVMSNAKDSMYKVAEEHKIPDWLINLRHEAAHGNSVPALFLLRQAGDIIFHWLRENYWEPEAESMTDVINDPIKEKENTSSKISELLDLWVVLKISQWSGFKTVDRIPFENFRDTAMELLTREPGASEKLTKPSEEEEILTFPLDHLKSNFDFDENSETDENETNITPAIKIKTTFEPLLRILFSPLKYKKHKKIEYQECLIESLIKSRAFCPEIEFENFDEPEMLEMMSLLGELWKELIEGLQSHKLLHCLMKALMIRTSNSQLTSAQMWLRLITHLLTGETPPQPQGTEYVCQILSKNLPCNVDPKILLTKANLHHIKHQRAPCLKSPSAREIEVLQQLAKKVLESPTTVSSRYLKSLLQYWESPLSNTTVQKLSTLAQMYCGIQQPVTSHIDEVQSVTSLINHGLSIQSEETNEETLPDASSLGPWKLYTGSANWSKCALGVLPWENENNT